MIDFPIDDLMHPQTSYDILVDVLHPHGLGCPRCHRHDCLGVHRRRREPVLDYQCGQCGCVFNAFTGTALHGTRRSPAQILMILRGFAKGVPTAVLARELGCDRKHLLELRHKLQGHVLRASLEQGPLEDDAVESDETFVDAGQKGQDRGEGSGPGRRRGNQRRGRGTFANDRPPVLGLSGRDSGETRLGVAGSTRAEELKGFVLGSTREGTTVYTDDWQGYEGIEGEGGRHRESVDHGGPRRCWAEDRDGDGMAEVHCNTQEGFWAGLETFLRAFRGVSKWYLGQYVAMYEWARKVKRATHQYLRMLLGRPHSTIPAS